METKITSAHAQNQDQRTIESGKFSKLINSFGIYFVTILLLLIGMVLQSTGAIKGFFSVKNFLNIVDAVSLLGIVAVGMSFITYSGHFADMSAPTTMAFTGIVAVQMLQFGFWPAMLAALAAGLIIGLVNALVIGRFKANPIIWTLAVNYVTMGVIRVVWANKQIYPDMITKSKEASQLFDSIYRFQFFHVLTFPTFLLIVLIILGQLILTRTSFGMQLKLTGSARKAAKFSGVPVEFVVGLAFVLAAVAETLGGLAVTSLSRVGAWYNGAGYDFKAVTAIVIGGMTLAGGRGSIIGVLGGVLFIGVLNNIMTLLGIGTFSQDIIRGAIFIIVVGINAKSLRNLGRDDA